MKKEKLLILLLVLLSTVTFGQVDIIRTKAVTATQGASTFNKQAVVDANLKAYLNLSIPRASSFTLNNAKDTAGYIMYNTSIMKMGIYKGPGLGWDTLSTSTTSQLLNYYNKTQSDARYVKLSPSTVQNGTIGVNGIITTVNGANVASLVNGELVLGAATGGGSINPVTGLSFGSSDGTYGINNSQMVMASISDSSFISIDKNAIIGLNNSNGNQYEIQPFKFSLRNYGRTRELQIKPGDVGAVVNYLPSKDGQLATVDDIENSKIIPFNFNSINIPFNSPPIIQNSVSGWDQYVRETGNVYFDKELNKFLMPYSAHTLPYVSDNVYVGLATSDDGYTWTKQGQITFTPTEDPYLVKKGSTYYLYAEKKSSTLVLGIECFTSTDLVTWTSQGVVLSASAQPSIDGQDVSSPTVLLEDGIFYLYYEARGTLPSGGSGSGQAGLVCLATSTDGINFTKSTANPIYAGTNIGGNMKWATHLVPDDIIKIGNTYYLSVHAFNGKTFALGIAQGTDKINFYDSYKTWLTVNDTQDDNAGNGIMFWKNKENNALNVTTITNGKLYQGTAGTKNSDNWIYTSKTSATYKILAASRNEIIETPITADRTFILGNDNSLGGVVKVIKNNSAFNLTIQPDTGGVTINGSTSNIIVAPNDIKTLVLKSNNTWSVLSTISSSDVATKAYVENSKIIPFNFNTFISPYSTIPIIQPNENSEFRETGNVIYDASIGKYVMPYSESTLPYVGNNVFLGLATSTDGISWTKQGSIIDTVSMEDPFLVKNGSTYYLYAEKKVGSTSPGIQLFTSTNLTTWTDRGLILTANTQPSIEGFDVSSPTILLENGIFYLYYEGRGTLPSGGATNGQNGAVFLATSTDGITFTKQGLIYAGNNLNGNMKWATHLVPDDIVKVNGIYYLSMHVYNGNKFVWAVASSTDRINFYDYQKSNLTVDIVDGSTSSSGVMFVTNKDTKEVNSITIVGGNIYAGYLGVKNADNWLFSTKTTGTYKIFTGNRNEIIETPLTSSRTFVLGADNSLAGAIKIIKNTSNFTLTLQPDSLVTIDGSSSNITIPSLTSLELRLKSNNVWTSRTYLNNWNNIPNNNKLNFGSKFDVYNWTSNAPSLLDYLVISPSTVNKEARIGIWPNGAPADLTDNSLISGLKLFGTDFNADQANNFDFGLYTTPNSMRFNSKRNGTATAKPFMWSFQDNTVQAVLTPEGNFGIGTNFLAPTSTLHVSSSSTIGSQIDVSGNVANATYTGQKITSTHTITGTGGGVLGLDILADKKSSGVTPSGGLNVVTNSGARNGGATAVNNFGIKNILNGSTATTSTATNQNYIGLINQVTSTTAVGESGNVTSAQFTATGLTTHTVTGVSFSATGGTTNIAANILAGTVRFAPLTASLPLKLNSTKDVISSAIDLSGTEVTNTLTVAKGGTGVTTSTGTGSVVLSASPTLTGLPLAPTALAGTNTTQIATTAFVTNSLASKQNTINSTGYPYYNGTTLTSVNGGINDMLIGNGTFASINPRVRAVTFSTLTPTNTAIAVNDDLQTVVNKTQGQFNALPTISSGTYTPTSTLVLNATAITLQSGHYTRIGNEVTVTIGFIALDATTGGFTVDVSLPIASNLGATNDVIGMATVVGSGSNAVNFKVSANSTDDRARIGGDTTGLSGVAGTITFTYTII